MELQNEIIQFIKVENKLHFCMNLYLKLNYTLNNVIHGEILPVY